MIPCQLQPILAYFLFIPPCALGPGRISFLRSYGDSVMHRDCMDSSAFWFSVGDAVPLTSSTGGLPCRGHYPTHCLSCGNWSRHRDLNSEPADYGSAALPIELYRQECG